jgi:hypothetical protein
MVDVFHHMSEPYDFLKEASRCLKSGGIIAMIEPWFTPMSQWIYKKFHHEPFLPESKNWGLKERGPLTGANGALPWIVFQRDRELFLSEFPSLKVQSIKLLMPFSYLLSGGVSLRSFQPGWSYCFWRKVENIWNPFISKMAMFALIVIERK